MNNKDHIDFLEILKLWFEFTESLDKKDFSADAVLQFMEFLQQMLNKRLSTNNPYMKPI
jgi:hypothetical protein